MNRRALALIAVVTIVSLVGLFLLLISNQTRLTGTLAIQSAPSAMTLKLNGRVIQSSGDVRVPAGDHTLEASQEGFETKTIQVSIEEREREEIIIFLQPVNAEGESYLASNPNEAYAIEGLVGSAIDEEAQQAVQRNPIIEDLPVADRTFRIDYGPSRKDPNKPEAIAIIIRAIDKQGREDALNWMRTFGYNPSDYEIVYINPLEEN